MGRKHYTGGCRQIVCAIDGKKENRQLFSHVGILIATLAFLFMLGAYNISSITSFSAMHTQDRLVP